jgi:hypothetical protein
VLWASSYDGGVDDYALGVATDALNNVIVTGYSRNVTAGNYDYYTIKYDPAGNVLWARSYDGVGHDWAYGVATDSLNNVIVTGSSYNATAGNYDYYTIKYTCLPTQSLGDIPGGGNATATWTLHCDNPGDSTITVTAAGTDGNTGEPIPGANITPDSVTVEQQTKAHLVVEITSPLGTETYSTCQNFNLTFTIHNSGEADALNATATIDPGATAEVGGQGQGVS